jgi:hypothetical protein
MASSPTASKPKRSSPLTGQLRGYVPQSTPVKRPNNPFTSLLTRAADRLYAEPVSLADALRTQPLVTLHAISSEPERFGPLQPFGETELRRQRIRDLITTARIFLAHEHKMQRDERRQGLLALPEQTT